MAKKNKGGLPSAFLLDARLEEVLCQLLKIDSAEWSATKALYASGTAWSRCVIPKKKGVRIINPPSDPLKRVSRALLTQMLQGIPVHTAVHGAHPGTSIVTNARVHAGFAKAFYLLDLKDAFPSVDRARMRANLGPKLLTRVSEATDIDPQESQRLVDVLLELLLVEDVMPQGFPTSPAVLNIVLGPVDREISRLLREETVRENVTYRYTRFLDDLTITTDANEIPKSLRQSIRKVIRHNGWTIQRTKLRYYGEAPEGDEERTTKMPEVTGIIPHPDGRLTIARGRLNRFRGIIHGLLKEADARLAADAEALAKVSVQMEEDVKVFAAAGKTLDPTLSPDQFYARDWPLTTEEHDLVAGIVGFVGMVYDGDLPAIIRKPYLEAKTRFRIGMRHLSGGRGYRVALTV